MEGAARPLQPRPHGGQPERVSIECESRAAKFRYKSEVLTFASFPKPLCQPVDST
jgi:hypothetical protein